jgi:hypothetical protein
LKEGFMITNIQLDAKAPWKQRFRAPDVIWNQIAPANPARGLVINNASGTYQLYAWDVPTNTLRQLTDRPEGCLDGVLSGDGRYVYYLDDRQGNEIGHFVRIPFENGEAQDLTPDLPSYSSFAFTSSGSGVIGFMAADADGFDIQPETSQRRSCFLPVIPAPRSPTVQHFPMDMEVVFVATTDRHSATLQLLAFDTRTAGKLSRCGMARNKRASGGIFPTGDLRLAGQPTGADSRPSFGI